MRKNISGFTMVELLIVIVIIAILATLTLVTYSGIQTRALNTSRLIEVQAWQKQLSMYYARNGANPSVPAGNYCLGSGFPNGKCRNSLVTGPYTYNESDDAALMSQLAQVGDGIPSGPRQAVNGLVGPFVNLWSGNAGYTIFTFFNGGSSSCPTPMTYAYDDGAGAVMCQIDVKNY